MTVSDTLPAGLTATAISGPGWSCTLVPLTCTRGDALAAAASYPVITVTVSVANNGLVFNPVVGNPAFQASDILVSMADGTVQWRRHDWTLVKVLASGTDGQAKGLAFDTSGNLYVTHWIGSGSSGNDVVRFDRNGNLTGLFGTGFDCNPSSIVFDNNGNAYVGHADCQRPNLQVRFLRQSARSVQCCRRKSRIVSHCSRSQPVHDVLHIGGRQCETVQRLHQRADV